MERIELQKKSYVSPELKTIEFQPQAIICQGMNGGGTDGCGDGNTDCD